MLGFFYKLARKVVSGGGTVSFEWPRYCAGWDLPDLVSLISEFNLIQANTDGCAVGVRSIVTGKPIKKPWKFYCSQPQLAELLDAKKCSRDHEHTICSGRDTKLTGFLP